jgi:dynein heavy chain
MSKVLKGVTSSGSWACFDEFNRMHLEVLSVIAQQVMIIQKAISSGMSKLTFEGSEICIDRSSALFVTINPGYSGRSALPTNLKLLFRPVAMINPDIGVITEVLLFSSGFKEAKVISVKIISCFKLFLNLLSKQTHYDFGMRTMRAIIAISSDLCKAFPKSSELQIVSDAMFIVIVPKLVFLDEVNFREIMADIFSVRPYIPSQEDTYVLSITQAVTETNLLPVDAFITRCLHFNEIARSRSGIMLVGPPGGGKTACYKSVHYANTVIEKKMIQIHTFYPTSMCISFLFGYFDSQRNEWVDGLLPCFLRKEMSVRTNYQVWYIFDGPINSSWIESLNTALDDNKKLCLPSGEVISLSNCQTLIFETESLCDASPATISRCGIVHCDTTSIGLMSLVKQWISVNFVQISVASSIEKLFNEVGIPAITFLRKCQHVFLETSDVGLVQSCLKIILILLRKLNESTMDEPPVGLDNLFYFSLIWSVGIIGDTSFRKKFSVWLDSAVPGQFPLRNDDTVYDFNFDLSSGGWLPWELDLIKFPSNVVSIRENVRNRYISDLIIEAGCHIILCGPPGSGKTATIKSKFQAGLESIFVPLTINLSSKCPGNQIQQNILNYIEKKGKGTIFLSHVVVK